MRDEVVRPGLAAWRAAMREARAACGTSFAQIADQVGVGVTPDAVRNYLNRTTAPHSSCSGRWPTRWAPTARRCS